MTPKKRKEKEVQNFYIMKKKTKKIYNEPKKKFV